jgi:outer membrane protein assembly factor BamD
MNLKFTPIIPLLSLVMLLGCKDQKEVSDNYKQDEHFSQRDSTRYNKVLKSGNNELKKVRAIYYYEQGDWIKAITLLEDIIPFYKLTPEGEKLYFYYCMANYKLEDYYLAGYYFSRFVRQYPRSPYCEEAMFLSALCSVHNSPKYSLDQTETYNALDGIQVFIDMYPNSARIDTCNIIMDKLRAKLELKQFEYAKLYYKTENYKAAVVALNATLEKFPESAYEEEIRYLLVLSNFELAINSIPSKKLERLNETLKSYRKFVAEFPQSEKLKELEGIKERTEEEIELLKTENNGL